MSLRVVPNVTLKLVCEHFFKATLNEKVDMLGVSFFMILQNENMWFNATNLASQSRRGKKTVKDFLDEYKNELGENLCWYMNHSSDFHPSTSQLWATPNCENRREICMVKTVNAANPIVDGDYMHPDLLGYFCAFLGDSFLMINAMAIIRGIGYIDFNYKLGVEKCKVQMLTAKCAHLEKDWGKAITAKGLKRPIKKRKRPIKKAFCILENTKFVVGDENSHQFLFFVTPQRTKNTKLAAFKTLEPCLGKNFVKQDSVSADIDVISGLLTVSAIKDVQHCIGFSWFNVAACSVNDLLDKFNAMFF